jgi:hypothetical protein
MGAQVIFTLPVSMAALKLFFISSLFTLFVPLLPFLLNKGWTWMTTFFFVQRSMHQIHDTLPAASRHQSSEHTTSSFITLEGL